MTLERWFSEILVCPESKTKLIYFPGGEFLFSPDSRLRYRIEDGVPVLLVEEAERLDEAQAAKLVEQAKSQGLTD